MYPNSTGVVARQKMTSTALSYRSTNEVSIGATFQQHPPLVVHIIHRLAVGGLENGLVNLINGTAPERYRHAIISLTDYTEFRSRIQHADVPVIALHKHPGKDFRTHFRLWRLLRTLRPAIVHTRNLPALEFCLVASLAGVPARIHGEHGRDTYDIDGSNRKYNRLRKIIRPFVSRYTAVSEDLSEWLVRTVGVAAERVVHICNGVDTRKFYPRNAGHPPIGPDGFGGQGKFIIGTVGRMEVVKDQLTLVRAFLHLIQTEPTLRDRLRLVMIGDGPLRDESRNLLRAAAAESLAWLPGERADIPDIMRGIDLFILPSIAEGISNTILEAMASGVAVIATNVGGNPELVQIGRTGSLVPARDPPSMANAIRAYVDDLQHLRQHGDAARERVEKYFSIDAMINRYLDLYDAALARL